MGYFYWLNIVHIAAAVAAVGPLLLAPWLAAQVVRSTEGGQSMLRTLHVTDTFYNRAGWLLILSGAVLFYLTDWHRAFHAWFLLCIGLFVIDSIVEAHIREPALAQLSGLHEYDPAWCSAALRLRKGVFVQTISAVMILLLMLLRPNLT